MRVALLDVLHEAAQRDADRAIVDRDGAVERRARTCAASDEERVVVDPFAVGGEQAVLVRLDPARAPRSRCASKSAAIAASGMLRAFAISNGSATAIGR